MRARNTGARATRCSPKRSTCADTSLLSAWDGEARDIEQNIALAVVARSPIERLLAIKQERGWHALKLYSDVDGRFSRDYNAMSGDDEIPELNVFTRRDATPDGRPPGWYPRLEY